MYIKDSPRFITNSRSLCADCVKSVKTLTHLDTATLDILFRCNNCYNIYANTPIANEPGDSDLFE